jgi:hypothetical protein
MHALLGHLATDGHDAGAVPAHCAIDCEPHYCWEVDTTNGFKAFTPVPAKSAALRVTTVTTTTPTRR